MTSDQTERSIVMSEVNEAVETSEPMVAPAVESPPAADRPAVIEVDPRGRLYELARLLARTHDRGLMVEYLRLRRSVR
jgi:hypothetical protein